MAELHKLDRVASVYEFFDSAVIRDKTLVAHHTTETKRQSSNWRHAPAETLGLYVLGPKRDHFDRFPDSNEVFNTVRYHEIPKNLKTAKRTKRNAV